VHHVGAPRALKRYCDGNLPVTSSRSTTPRQYTSDLADTVPRVAPSGDRNANMACGACAAFTSGKNP
jgi:hypothetical protein